ncbi:Uncharacterised protein [Salmonella enterica subsp. enterica serovar Typhi]|nr:Uncharacterised protein [Salmonella enterica subsp. enterica serovar Typhi]
MQENQQITKKEQYNLNILSLNHFLCIIYAVNHNYFRQFD